MSHAKSLFLRPQSPDECTGVLKCVFVSSNELWNSTCGNASKRESIYVHWRAFRDLRFGGFLRVLVTTDYTITSDILSAIFCPLENSRSFFDTLWNFKNI